MRTILKTCAVATLAFASTATWAQQDYPSKTITIVAPYAAGGSIDAVARLIGKHLGERLNETVIVKNLPGAGGTVGTGNVARSAPDGYTLILASNGPNAVGPSLYPHISYDGKKDFAPITMLALQPMFFAVPANSPLQSIQDLVELGKKERVNYGSAGIGSLAHLTGELFKGQADIDLQHVPYKGTAPVTVALLASEIPLAVVSALDVIPHIKSGTIRALATSTRTRSDALPDVPTVAESGFPDFHTDVWYGLMAPAGTPDAIVKRLSQEVTAILASPETQESFAKMHITPTPTSPEEFQKVLFNDIDTYARIIKDAGISAQ